MTKTLHGLRIRRETITYDGQEFEVRGFGAPDLMTLTATHGAVLAMVFGKIQTERQPGAAVTSDQVKSILRDVSGQFPDLAAAVIAIASESADEEGMAVARQLPLPVQVEALEAIFALTFTSEAEVKKLVESLTRMAVAASGALTGVSLSPTGIGESAVN